MVDDSVVVPLDDIHVDERLNDVEISMTILDKKMKALCNKVVPLVKVSGSIRRLPSGLGSPGQKYMSTIQIYLQSRISTMKSSLSGGVF